MVVQYPHTLIVTWKLAPVKDGNGEWVSSEGENGRFESECRAEPNGNGTKLTGVDGSLIDFAFSVFMPRTSQVIPVEAIVEITMGNEVITGKAKRAHNGQMNSRIWL